VARELILRIEREGQLLAEWGLADGPLQIVVHDPVSDEEVLRLSATSGVLQETPAIAVVQMDDEEEPAFVEAATVVADPDPDPDPEITDTLLAEESGQERPEGSVKTDELPDVGARALLSNAPPPKEWEDSGDTLVGRLHERAPVDTGGYDEIPHLENIEGASDDLSMPAPDGTGGDLSLPLPEATFGPVDDFTMPVPEHTDAEPSDVSIVDGGELTGSLVPDSQNADDVEQFDSLTGALEDEIVVLSVWLRRNGEWIGQGEMACGERAKLGGGHIRLVEDGTLEVATGPWLAGSITLGDGEQQALAPASPVQRVATAVEAMLWDAETALYVRAQAPSNDAPPVEYARSRRAVQYNPPSSDL